MKWLLLLIGFISTVVAAYATFKRWFARKTIQYWAKEDPESPGDIQYLIHFPSMIMLGFPDGICGKATYLYNIKREASGAWKQRLTGNSWCMYHYHKASQQVSFDATTLDLIAYTAADPSGVSTSITNSSAIVSGINSNDDKENPWLLMDDKTFDYSLETAFQKYLNVKDLPIGRGTPRKWIEAEATNLIDAKVAWERNIAHAHEILETSAKLRNKANIIT
jgi:hypothetical protein